LEQENFIVSVADNVVLFSLCKL